MQPADWGELTLLFYQHVNPYGTFRLYMNERMYIDEGLLKTDKRDALSLANHLYNQLEKGIQVADKLQLVRWAIPPTLPNEFSFLTGMRSGELHNGVCSALVAARLVYTLLHLACAFVIRRAVRDTLYCLA